MYFCESTSVMGIYVELGDFLQNHVIAFVVFNFKAARNDNAGIFYFYRSIYIHFNNVLFIIAYLNGN